jgi:hypothetical protein
MRSCRNRNDSLHRLIYALSQSRMLSQCGVVVLTPEKTACYSPNVPRFTLDPRFALPDLSPVRGVLVPRQGHCSR